MVKNEHIIIDYSQQPIVLRCKNCGQKKIYPQIELTDLS